MGGECVGCGVCGKSILNHGLGRFHGLGSVKIREIGSIPTQQGVIHDYKEKSMKVRQKITLHLLLYIGLSSVVFAQPVHMPDQNLRSLIIETLDLPQNHMLTRQDMLKLENLDAGGNRNITNLMGLEFAINIATLGLYHNPIEDIGPLADMTKMTGFNLWGCRIVDLSPLRDLQNLNWIVLGNNQVSDISPLAGLINLTTFHVDSNQIVDISPLTSLTRLEELRLNRNSITDITPLTKLKNLQKLHLADNPFHDFSPLFELEGVELDIEISEEFNAIVEVPDPNLRLLIREALSLPETVPLTQGQMQRLTTLDAGGGPWNQRPNSPRIRNQSPIPRLVCQPHCRYQSLNSSYDVRRF